MLGDKEKAMQLLRAGRFRNTNGTVLQAINLLHIKYIPLKDITTLLAVGDTTLEDIQKSVNFLQRAGYIEVRDISTKAATQLADSDIQKLEAIVSEKGIRLLSGEVDDAQVVFTWG